MLRARGRKKKYSEILQPFDGSTRQPDNSPSPPSPAPFLGHQPMQTIVAGGGFPTDFFFRPSKNSHSFFFLLDYLTADW
jgi:hypothetical protein